MLNLLKNIYVILVSPQYSGNIGSSARAMKNMGFSNLILVNPECEINQETRKMASNANDIVDKIKIFDTLKNALSGIAYVFGTTAKKRGNIIYTGYIQEISEKLYRLSENNKIAILFGSERDGLSKEEIAFCDEVFSINANKEYPTLNIAQAVLIVCYEIYNRMQRPVSSTGKKLALSSEKQFLYKKIKNLLLKTDYFEGRIVEERMKNIENIFKKANLTSKDIQILVGMFNVIDKEK